MEKKPTYEELEYRVTELERQLKERTAELSMANSLVKRRRAYRTRAEKAQRESEEFSSSLLNNSPNPMLVINPDTSVRYVNLALEEITGFSSDELIGKKAPYPWCTEKTLHKTGKDFEEAINKGARKLEEFFQKKTGEGFRVEINSAAIKKDGKLNYYLSNWFEITARKKAEEALRETHDYLENLISSINAPTIVWDPDFRVTLFNHAFERMTGLTADDVIGQELRMLFPESSLDVSLRNIEHTTLCDEYWESVEIPILCKDGDIRIVLWNSANICAEDGRSLLATIAQGVDITDRKQAQEALRDREERYRSLVESTEDSIYLVDRNCGYLFMNQKHLSRFGLPTDKVIGKTYGEFHSKEETKEFAEKVKAVFETGQSLSYEHRSQINDGYFLRTLSPVKEPDGRTTAVTVVSKDVSVAKRAEEEQKKLQSQLQQAQRMESIGTLAGGIAHNFNNVLMGIQGYASLMLLDIEPPHPHYERLKGIEKQVQSGAELTKQLLGFARGGRYEVIATNLNELIKTQNRMFGRTKKEITIRGKYQDNPWTVEVDQGQINQVILNLYVNAWQAMPKGGDLYVQTENVTLDENYTKPFNVTLGRYVKISITDTGVGMDEETQKRIFDPFFTTKEMERGTGLGLASVYGIIKNHGGIINVYSEKGAGSIFTIYLPASEREVIEEKVEVGKVLKGKETILLVDDEDIIIDVGKQLLQTLGYKVLIARGGKEAIGIVSKAHRAKRKEEEGKKLHARPVKSGEYFTGAPSAMPPVPDIVILDMIMPGMGGGETYDRMKEINPNIKVLLSSGYGIDGQVKEILKRGCNSFIQKPFNMKGLSQELRKILDKD